MVFDSVLSRMSYHVVYDDSILDSIEFAHRNGFSGVQIAVDSPHLSFQNISRGEISKIRAKSKSYGIRITLHGPDNLSLFNSDEEICRGMFSYYSKLFAFANIINSELVTVHAGGPEAFPTDAVPSEMFPKQDIPYYKKVFEKNLSKIILLSRGKVKLCLENYLFYDFMLKIIQDNIKKIYLCWDLPKTYNKEGGLNLELNDFFTKNISRVKQVHLHDIAGGRSHMVIGKGFIDFYQYLELLKDYDVWDYCIEVRPRDKAVESLQSLKRILSKS
jgi:sugar phosphate isomerase/epimerase